MRWAVTEELLDRGLVLHHFEEVAAGLAVDLVCAKLFALQNPAERLLVGSVGWIIGSRETHGLVARLTDATAELEPDWQFQLGVFAELVHRLAPLFVDALVGIIPTNSVGTARGWTEAVCRDNFRSVWSFVI